MTAPAAAEPAPAPPNRLPLILGIGVGAILGLFILSRVAGGGGDGAAPETSVTVPPPSGPTTSTPAAPEPPPIETFEVFTTKNPFQPLRSAARPTGTSGSSTTRSGSTSGGTDAASTSGSSAAGDGRETGTGTGAGGGVSGGSAEPRRGERVTLRDVFADKGRTMGNVQVDDTVHKVGAGDVFATSYKVISLSQSDGCGRFLFGDDQFRLCEGEEVIK